MNPPSHPEIGPSSQVGVVDRPTGATGTLVFDRPTAPTQNPQEVIASAIAGGVTMAGRVQQMQEALNPPSEQK